MRNMGVHVTGDMLLVALVSVLTWVGRSYVKELKDHIAVCDKRAVHSAAVMQWVGDGMHAIATKVGADIPNKPRKED